MFGLNFYERASFGFSKRNFFPAERKSYAFQPRKFFSPNGRHGVSESILVAERKSYAFP